MTSLVIFAAYRAKTGRDFLGRKRATAGSGLDFTVVRKAYRAFDAGLLPKVRKAQK